LHNYSFDPVKRKTFETITWQDYQDQIDGTLKGAFHCTKAVVPGMIQRKRGKIINILTNLVNNPVVAYHDYTTAKAAMVGFSRNLAAELGPLGIRVNMIAPGLTLPTDAARATTEEVKSLVASITPLRKVGNVEEVAKVVALFASPDMDWVTGSYTTADGGLVMY
jgi:3-oxoacyl-[acyl-carrier protein] reductase